MSGIRSQRHTVEFVSHGRVCGDTEVVVVAAGEEVSLWGDAGGGSDIFGRVDCKRYSYCGRLVEALETEGFMKYALMELWYWEPSVKPLAGT